MTTETTDRPLHVIAREIESKWANVNYAAKPYLDAMKCMGSAQEKYGHDDGKSVVLYFLGNARAWRGEDAKRIKAELKKML